jgi:Ca2+-binding RTX toxin-like protein
MRYGIGELSATGLQLSVTDDVVGDLGSIEQVLKDNFVLHSGCSCATCMEGGANQSDGGPVFADDIVPGSLLTNASVAVGGSLTVSIDITGDRDWYSVELTQGISYTIQTASSGSSPDAYLNLRDATGSIIAFNDDGGDGLNSLISFTAGTSGTYYIDAGTYNNLSTGSFRLFVAPAFTSFLDPVGGSTASAATLAIGGTVNGRIDYANDHDFYAVNLVAGQTYLFRTAGTSSSTTTDTIMWLRDAAGNALTFNGNVGEAGFSAIRYTATTTGTHYIDVSGFSSSTGTFNLTAFAAPTPSLYTNDQIATQLTSDFWGGQTRRFDVTTGGTITVNVGALTIAGQSLARLALDLWSDATGIIFSEVGTGGQITFDDNSAGAFASSVLSGGFITSSQVNVSTAWLAVYGAGLNSYSFQTYIHEIGHALGLGHAGSYNGTGDYVVDSSYLNDSWATTVMSYFDQTENSYFGDQGFTRQFVGTPLMADLIAVNNLYGTATNTRTGDTIYGVGNNSGRFSFEAYNAPLTVTIVDHGGVDTLNYSGYRFNQRIDLNPETFSNVGGQVGNLSIARGTTIENAVGGLRHDVLIGNALANRLEGSSGDDEFTGGGGSDVLIGGGGADVAIFAGDQADYSVVTAGGVTTVTGLGIRAGDGTDRLTEIESIRFANATIALGGDPNNPVEIGTGGFSINSFDDSTEFNFGLPSDFFFDLDPGTVLTFVATLADGSPLPAWLSFDAATQIFTGTAPISTINTVVEIRVTASDQSTSATRIFGFGIVEAPGAPIEGTTGPDQLYGTFRNETIFGLDGDDRFYSSPGSDYLIGGGGFDIIDFSALAHRVHIDLTTGIVDSINGGFVQEIEGAIGTGFDDFLTGTDSSNQLFGMDGDDNLFGMGGVDALYGGAGNDHLSIRGDSGSTVDGGTGFDTLYIDGQDISFAAITGFEAIDFAGASVILTGSQLASAFALNTIVNGNGSITINMAAGVNLITKLFDFSVFSGNIAINGTNGMDFIKLGHVENIVNAGDGTDVIQGGNFADTINGGAGVDKIAGNLGADVLTGGAGNDVFKYRRVDDSNSGNGIDVITDFTVGQDRLNFVRIDTNPALVGSQGFAFIGMAEFGATGTAQIRFYDAGADLQVEADVDGDGIADMEIILQGLGGQLLTADSFNLGTLSELLPKKFDVMDGLDNVKSVDPFTNQSASVVLPEFETVQGEIFGDQFTDSVQGLVRYYKYNNVLMGPLEVI